MSVKYNDREIEKMIMEPKPHSAEWRQLVRLRQKRGHKGAEVPVTGANGTPYRLVLRQSDFNPLDFSIILAVVPEGSSRLFR